MTLLKPLGNTSLLTPYEQYCIHSLHKEGKLISEQSPGDPNPLILLAIDPAANMTMPVVYKITHNAQDYTPAP